MVSDLARRRIRQIAELIANADALLITAGAGMGVDSGLPDFRGANGFWSDYPALASLGVSFEQMAQPQWFTDAPDMAWAFYGHRQRQYRESDPHAGYRMLRDWGRALPLGSFVVTSNVDGHFYKAGFAADRVLEQHGNIFRHQCTVHCSRSVWQDETPPLKTNLQLMRTFGDLPRCPECGALARPNVMMFNDTAWLDTVRKWQQERYSAWLSETSGRRLVIVECGAGRSVDTIRRLSERVALRRRTHLIRINPADSEYDESATVLRMPALDALTLIEQNLPESFRARMLAGRDESAAVLSQAGLHANSPGRARSDSDLPCDHVEMIKWNKAYSVPWQVSLPSGQKAWVDQLYVSRVNLGLIGGLPCRPKGYRYELHESVARMIRDHFHGPAPVVISPRMYDGGTNCGIAPTLQFVAQIVSYEALSPDDDGSWMNLVWFADVDDTKSIQQFIAEALAQLDWRKQATGYSI